MRRFLHILKLKKVWVPFTLFILLVFGIGAGLPYWMHGKSTLHLLENIFYNSMGVPVTIGEIKFYWTPTPHIEVHDLHLNFPEDNEEIRIPLLTGTPAYFSMLRGKLEFYTLTARNPEVHLRYRPGDESILDKIERLPSPDEIDQMLDDFTKKLPVRRSMIEEGHLVLYRGEKVMLEFSRINSIINFNQSTINLTCESNAFKKLVLQADLDPTGGEDVIASVQYLRLDRLLDGLFPNVRTVGPTVLSAKLGLFRDRQGLGQGKLNIQGPQVTFLQRPSPADPPLIVKDVRVDILAQFNGPEVIARVTQLHLGEQIDVQATALYNTEPAEAHPMLRIHVRSQSIKAEEVWPLAVGFIGRQPALISLMHIFPKGQLDDFRFRLVSDDLQTAFQLENVSLLADVKHADIHVDIAHLSLTDTSGHLHIKNGDLEAENISAVASKEDFTFSNGTFFLSEAAPHDIRVDTEVKGNIASVPAFVKNFISNAKVLQEINQIQHLKGMAKGHFKLDYIAENMTIDVTLDDSDILFGHPEIAPDIRVNSGNIRWDESEGVEIEDMSGFLGQTHIQGFDLHVPKQGGIKAAVDDVTLPVIDIITYLQRVEKARPILQKIEHATGVVRIQNIIYEQTPAGHIELDGHATIQKPIEVKTDYFPVPFMLLSGGMRIQTERLTFEKIAARFPGAAVTVDGMANIHEQKLGAVEVTLNGQVDEEIIPSLAPMMDLSAVRQVHLPVMFRNLKARYENGVTDINGGFATSAGASGNINAAVTSAQTFAIRGLTVTDGLHTATLGLDWHEGLRSVSLNGTLTPAMADQILTNHPLTGTLSGDMTVRMASGDVKSLQASGTLRIYDFKIPNRPTLQIENALLTGQGRTVSVDSLTFTGPGQTLTATGRIRLTETGFFLSLEANSDKVDLDEILNAMEDSAHQIIPKTGISMENFPFTIGGEIQIVAREVHVQNQTLRFVVSTIGFEEDVYTINIANASFCGVPMYGTILYADDKVQVDIRAGEREIPMRQFLRCVMGDGVQAEGHMRVVGQITASAPLSQIKSALSGQVAFASENGILYQEGLVGGVLKVVNMVRSIKTEKGEGIPYKTFQGKVTIQNGIMTIDELYLDSQVIEVVGQGTVNLDVNHLDIVLLVSPLRTIDRIVEKIPIISHILGGSLLSIPVAITGSLENPNINPVSITNIGAGLLRIVGRTLTLPIQLVTPDSNKPVPAKELLKQVEDETESGTDHPAFNWRQYFGRNRPVDPTETIDPGTRPASATTATPTTQSPAPAAAPATATEATGTTPLQTP